MTGVSHAITGAVVAVVISEPLLALPVAFLSHFVCDAIPHIGIGDVKKTAKRDVAHKIYKIDLILILLFFGILFAIGAPWVVIAGAFLAGSPDFVWFYRYIIREKAGKLPPGPMNKISRFHKNIQWSETLKYGVPLEVFYSSIMLFVLFNQL